MKEMKFIKNAAVGLLIIWLLLALRAACSPQYNIIRNHIEEEQADTLVI